MNPNNQINVRNVFKEGNSASNQNLNHETENYMISNYLSFTKVDGRNKDEQDFAHIYGYC